MSGATSPAGDRHPGEIAYEDMIESRKWTRDAAEVPQTVAWVRDGESWAPVMRIVSSGVPGRRRIDKFGADGALLESTVQAPPPNRPSAPPTPELPPS